MKTLIKLLALCSLLVQGIANAIWFEASGQAIIEKGNKAHARQQATQEAIKQALLYAGASVSSVQEMANGLLQEDRLEIRSGGEVRHVELLDERYQGDLVTVLIRADIFPQKISCAAADYQKAIVTSWFPIKHRRQAAMGGLHQLGQAMAQQIQTTFSQYNSVTQINAVFPDYLNQHNTQHQARMQLAGQHASQYVLLVEIADISVNEESTSSWQFWQADQLKRNLTLNYQLFNGVTGALIKQQQLSTSANWPFDTHSQQDVFSRSFWQSDYGKAAKQTLMKLAQQLEEDLACQPAYGKVLQVANNQLTINMGKSQGVNQGDSLTLLQLGSTFDASGKSHQQYRLHPEKLQVIEVFDHTATVTTQSGAPLANIQANDFVARR